MISEVWDVSQVLCRCLAFLAFSESAFLFKGVERDRGEKVPQSRLLWGRWELTECWRALCFVPFLLCPTEVLLSCLVSPIVLSTMCWVQGLPWPHGLTPLPLGPKTRPGDKLPIKFSGVPTVHGMWPVSRGPSFKLFNLHSGGGRLSDSPKSVKESKF